MVTERQWVTDLKLWIQKHPSWGFVLYFLILILFGLTTMFWVQQAIGWALL